MKHAYIDSSVLLRYLLGSDGQAVGLFSWEQAVSSTLLQLECRRTFHRLRLMQEINDAEFAALNEQLREMLLQFGLFEITPSVMEMAGSSFGVNLGSLDAIHLATAILWQPDSPGEKVIFTHDTALSHAARGCGLKVLD